MSLFVVFILALCVLVVYFLRRRARQLRRLRAKYKEALQTGNRRLALERGRRYFSEVRGGFVTQVDEQIIQNDLSTMPETPTK